jgi:hypothetical protein
MKSIIFLNIKSGVGGKTTLVYPDFATLFQVIFYYIEY